MGSFQGCGSAWQVRRQVRKSSRTAPHLSATCHMHSGVHFLLCCTPAPTVSPRDLFSSCAPVCNPRTFLACILHSVPRVLHGCSGLQPLTSLVDVAWAQSAGESRLCSRASVSQPANHPTVCCAGANGAPECGSWTSPSSFQAYFHSALGSSTHEHSGTCNITVVLQLNIV